MYLVWILYVLKYYFSLVTHPKAGVLRLVATLFISKTDEAVKLFFQQLSLGHYLVM